MAYIYKLQFASGDFYIGQTTNLKVRLTNHISNKGKGSPMLEQAFRKDAYTGHTVLAEVPETELDTKEMELIEELQPPLNTLPGGNGLRGLNHPRCKYSKEQILEVIRLFVETDITYEQISTLTEVQSSTVHDILKGRSHTWVLELLDPKLIEAAKQTRSKYLSVYDRDNKKYSVNMYTEIEKAHSLSNGTITRLKKTGKNLSGWSLTPHNVYKLVSPDNLEIKLTYPNAKEFLKEMGLSQYQISRLLDKSKSAGEWLVECYPQEG